MFDLHWPELYLFDLKFVEIQERRYVSTGIRDSQHYHILAQNYRSYRPLTMEFLRCSFALSHRYNVGTKMLG